MSKSKHSTFNNIVKFTEHEQPPRPSGLYAVEIGVIIDINPEGYPLVILPQNEPTSPRVALTQVDITPADIRKECTLAFVGGDPMRPLVLGLLRTPSSTPESDIETTDLYSDDILDIDSEEAVVIRSDQSIILQTGKSRIELYPDGHINLQGVYINSQAYGPNRIKGGSVKLN